jgi:polyribonucleotide nucleotidyltransferase
MNGIFDRNAASMVSLKKTYTIGGEEITLETGKLGLLINGAVTISDTNDNILFVTTGFKTKGLNENASFFPLVVDYQEKFYATGKIGGNRFQRREGRPSDSATLTARLIDRPIRPMFPKGIVNDTQVICTVLSASGEKELGFWGIIGASLGLQMWGAPFEGPVSSCNISVMNDGSYIFNPTVEQEKESKLNLLTAGTVDAITMIEAGGNEVSDELMLEAIEYSHNLIKEICAVQDDFVKEYEARFGITKHEATLNAPDESLYATVKEFLSEDKMANLYNKSKIDFQNELDNLDVIVTEYLTELGHISDEINPDIVQIKTSEVGNLVYKRVKETMRQNILEKGERLDGRKPTEVREVVSEVSLLPRTHGSALFRRGMTQSLSIATLGGPDDEMSLEGMMPADTKRYIHHYNFPPYSVGEVRMMRGVWRREIGHGALAERALLPVIPSEDEFPYVMRVVSEITTCNGSSSMASICGSTLSLMNAGVPIKTPVWGVAMGMIYDESTGKYVILSDIQAQEDFLGDMDFKVARTKNGITAMQLDVKIKGLKMEIFKEGFAQSHGAVEYILENMLKAQPEVAPELSKYAPLIMNMQIKENDIRVVIGKGWANVQRMEKDYGVKVSIADDGMTTITADTQEGGKLAIADIEALLWNPSEGEKYTGEVVKIIDGVGAIVSFKNTSGMIHISKLSPLRATSVEQFVKMGDMVDFTVIQVDLAKGRIGLARTPSAEEVKQHEESRKPKVEAPKKTEEK